LRASDSGRHQNGAVPDCPSSASYEHLAPLTDLP
jgi:hypothetical protein